MSTKVTDDTIGGRFCLICGAVYVDKHTECPHDNVKIYWPEFAKLLHRGVNEG